MKERCDRAHILQMNGPIISKAESSSVSNAMTHPHSSARPSRRPPSKAIGSLACALMLSITTQQAIAGIPAGEISFVIGQVQITNDRGTSRIAEAASGIATGDRIETGPSGHIHLRMVDGGFLSIRPSSRFVIEQYETTPGNTAIRFRLEEGVVRSITGSAAQVHKDRFRLNTPLAAIGVRGTDFVVQSGPDGVRARVNQGAIVVAPLGGNCLAQGLGPCSGGSARELSDSMGRVLLELKGMQAPTIVPINGKAPEGGITPPSQDLTSRQTLPVAAEAASAARPTTAPTFTPTAPPPASAEPAPTPVPPPAQIEISIPTTQPAEITQLRWGRWTAARDGDTLSTTTQEARQGRRVTVGNNYVNLYRQPDDARPLPAQLGQVSFSLAAAQVSLVQPTGASSAGVVNGGWLQIDFAHRQFSTELNVSHFQTGAAQVQATGAVTSDGTFYANKPGSLVTGAVTMDGSQAGYLFDKVVPQGTLSGATLWKR